MKMKHYEIPKLLNDSTVSKFLTKKQIEVNDVSSGQYSVNKNLRFKTSMLRSHFCTIESDEAQKDVVFKTNAPFRLFIDRQCRRY